MELVNIDDLKEMEYDGVIFDMQAVKERAFELVAKSPGYMNLLRVNVHRILNDEYAVNVKHGDKDIIKTGPQIESCRIIAPGPNLIGCKHVVDESMFTIACNMGVQVAVSDSLWLVTDANAEKCNWFYVGLEGMSDRTGPRCFPTDSLIKYNPEYTMHVAPCFPPKYDQRLLPGVILNGATIAGMALQIAFYLGAKTIELCGVDMDGDCYYDGTEATGHPNWDDFRTRMNNFIKVVQHQGVEIYSRTETTLDIEVRDAR